jgi:hypothetical protein
VSHYSCRIPVSHMAMIFQCLTWLWNSSVSYSCRIPVTGIIQLCETLKSHCHVRHWNIIVMWDTIISQPCEILKSHSHVRHWNSSCVSHGYEISGSRMVVKYQCLTSLWNSSVWHDCGNPVSDIMSYLWYMCLFAQSDVQHILCCVFASFFFVLCALCCQFL